MVTCSGVGVQRHVTLVSIDYPKAMRLPGTTASTIVGQKRRSEGYLLVLLVHGFLKPALFVSGASTGGNSMRKGHMHRYE